MKNERRRNRQAWRDESVCPEGECCGKQVCEALASCRRDGRRGEEVGVFPSVCYPGECKRANLLDFVRETSERTERARRDCQVVTALTQTAT